MRPKSPAEDRDEDLFRSRLASILDPRHELLRLAVLIDRAAFDAAFGALYAEAGRPGLPTRLMAGLHLLKHAKGLSDEQVRAQWIENPYFQAFCGEAWFRHRLPLDRSSGRAAHGGAGRACLRRPGLPRPRCRSGARLHHPPAARRLHLRGAAAALAILVAA